MKRFWSRIHRGALGFLLLAVMTGQRAECGIPVLDYTHIITAIGNTAKNIKEWAEYMQNFRQYYSLVAGVYQGIHSWQGIEWLEALSVLELPFFDGIDGIDDLRDVAAGAMMTVQDLQGLYEEFELIERLGNDSRYRNMVAHQGRMQLLRSHWQRVAKIRMMITRALQRHQQEIERYRGQQKFIQARIELANSQTPVSAATIATLQAKLQDIQIKITGSEAALQDKLGAIRTKQQHDEDALQAKMQVSWSNDLEQNKRMQLMDQYWAGVFKKAGM